MKPAFIAIYAAILTVVIVTLISLRGGERRTNRLVGLILLVLGLVVFGVVLYVKRTV